MKFAVHTLGNDCIHKAVPQSFPFSQIITIPDIVALEYNIVVLVTI